MPLSPYREWSPSGFHQYVVILKARSDIYQKCHCRRHRQCWNPRNGHSHHPRSYYGTRRRRGQRFGDRPASRLHLPAGFRHERLSRHMELHVRRPSVHDSLPRPAFQPTSIRLRARWCPSLLEMVLPHQPHHADACENGLAGRWMCNPARAAGLRRSRQRGCHQVSDSSSFLLFVLSADTTPVQSSHWPFLAPTSPT